MRPTSRTRRTRSSLIAASVAVVGLVLAGCGGGGSDDSKSATDGGAASAEPSTTVVGNDGETTPTTAPAKKQDEVAAQTPPPPEERPQISTGLPVNASLSSSCVKPGEKQTITVDIGREGGVAYNAYYSDGKSGGMDGYYGGNNGGRTDKLGKYSDTWVIAPTAPAGPVLVDVVAIAKAETFDRGQAHLNFKVAKRNGTCD